MCFCSVMSRDWKTNAKTALGLLSLLATVFTVWMPVEAVTEHQRAVVQPLPKLLLSRGCMRNL